MTLLSVPDVPASSLQVTQVLDLIASGLRSGEHAVRAFALAPLSDSALQLDILRNPRLSARIDARLFDEKSWRMPDQLEDFRQAGSLIALLQHGPRNVSRSIGLAWNGNCLARLLLVQGKALENRLTRSEMHHALLLRAHGPADAQGTLPDDREIERDGQLCLWCWMAALPARIAPLGLAILLRDWSAHDAFKALEPDARSRRADLTDAWLDIALSPDGPRS